MFNNYSISSLSLQQPKQMTLYIRF